MPNYRRYRAPGGVYFFTVVTAGREPVFTGEVTRAALRAAIQTVRREHMFHIEAWALLLTTCIAFGAYLKKMLISRHDGQR